MVDRNTDLSSRSQTPTELGKRAQVVVHSVTGPPGTPLARWLERNVPPYGKLRPLIGPFPRLVVRIADPDGVVADAARALPDGAAKPEALAVLLRRAGTELSWGEPEVLPDAATFVRLCQARGISSVELVRSDPSLLTEMQLGAFFHAYWRERVLRHAAARVPFALRRARGAAGLIGFAGDAAFWSGVRSAATKREWHRFTRSSYLVFYYHRIGDAVPAAHEHLNLEPRRFDAQLRLLRLLRFRPLSPEELIAFHTEPSATLPPRRYVLAADDAVRDAVIALGRHAHLRPHVFVNTSVVGGSPWWSFGHRIADWDELRRFAAAGGVVASHCRDHPQLTTLDAASLSDQLEGSLRELEVQLSHVSPLFAYPHGLHDERVVSAVAAAGYQAAFTTEPGRNGAGTDVYCLRRIEVKNWDGYAALTWKTLTGEPLPWPWERLRLRRRAARVGHPDGESAYVGADAGEAGD